MAEFVVPRVNHCGDDLYGPRIDKVKPTEDERKSGITDTEVYQYTCPRCRKVLVYRLNDHGLYGKQWIRVRPKDQPAIRRCIKAMPTADLVWGSVRDPSSGHYRKALVAVR